MKKITWNDITLEKYYQIKNTLEVQDEYTVFQLLDTLFGIDSNSMPITEFSKYSKALDFLKEEVPTVNLSEQYTINDTVYNSNFNLTTLTAAQFIDYQNYVGTDKFEDYLSVFFIPEGHKYNDGYDMAKVKEDLLQLDFPTVKSLAFFFTLQLEAFTTHFLSSLMKSVRKMQLKKNQKKLLIEQIKKADLANLESFLLSLHTAKKQ